MPDFSQSAFPTIAEVTALVRSIINDTFPGANNQQGRIYFDSAPRVIPDLNSALRTVVRKLRNEGVTFPDKDNVILTNLVPVVTPNTSVQVYLSYTGYFNGTQMYSSPSLPTDFMQPYEIWEQTAGTGIEFQPMAQYQEGILSTLQGPNLGVWEWRDYKIFMPGATQAKNLRLRYKAITFPLNVPAANFASTNVPIIDSQEALAYHMAMMYAEARGAEAVASLQAKRDDAIDEMALEWVRRAQTIPYRRPAYGGSSDQRSIGPISGTGIVA